jgi:tripartite-type tricarboxylate transporter receptor subunit TctC
MDSKLVAALLVSLMPAAHAEQYPSRPIRVVVPFAPGGAVDIVARTVSLRLNDTLHQSVVVDNRSGAGGTIGTDIVAKAPPDGHTLLIGSMGVAVNAVLYPSLPYDTLKDLSPVTMIRKTAVARGDDEQALWPVSRYADRERIRGAGL